MSKFLQHLTFYSPRNHSLIEILGRDVGRGLSVVVPGHRQAARARCERLAASLIWYSDGEEVDA